ncbi:MAG TPA: Fic family protein [Chthoniobacteraceae bacterium]|nr:Fic family protein [Chthoniobacteraceae bacterium]
MKSGVPEEALHLLLAAIEKFPTGVSLTELIGKGELPPEFSRRTLQRYLRTLVNEGRLVAEGRTRNRRYRLGEMVDRPGTPVETGESMIPLSNDGREIKKAVNRALPQRQPVGYRRSFLEDYLPNETFYLTEGQRRELAAIGGNTLQPPEPAGTHARKILHRLLIDLSWNSSRLEGNTYSLLETERLLEFGRVAEGKDLRETQMILNHKAAIELLVAEAGEIGFNRYTLLNLHALLSDNLLGDPGASGRLRTIPVGIGGTVFHPLEVPQLVEECFNLLLQKAAAIADPFEQAFFVMVQIPYLQPFEDVNKRVSRLAANIPLIRLNLSPLSFMDVPHNDYIDGILGVYELNRVELLRDVFLWAYQRSSARYAAVRQSLGEPDPLRLQYREPMATAVREIVLERLGRKAAIGRIRKIAKQVVPAEVRERFIERVETDLLTLHEGNMARYRLRPSEFSRWKERWDRETGKEPMP